MCENIIRVFRDEKNDKLIPVMAESSEDEAASDKPEHTTETLVADDHTTEDKQEEEPQQAVVPPPVAENNSDVEGSAKDDDASSDGLPAEAPAEAMVQGARPSEVNVNDEVDEAPAQPMVQGARPSEVNDEVDEVTPGDQVDEAAAEPVAEPVRHGSRPVEVKETAPEPEKHGARPVEVGAGDEVDEVTPGNQMEGLPAEPTTQPTTQPTGDDVDEVQSLPAEPPAQPAAESQPEPNTENLQSPREDFFPDEPEVITHSNLPPGWDIDPRNAMGESTHRSRSKKVTPPAAAEPATQSRPQNLAEVKSVTKLESEGGVRG